MKVAKKILSEFELYIAGAFLSVMIMIAAINAFSRYLFNRPIRAADEIVLTLFIWCIFLGAAYCYKKKFHIGIDIFVSALPRYLNIAVRLLVGLILIGTNVMMAHLSWQQSVVGLNRMIPMLQIPYTWRNAAAFISFSLMALYAIYFFYLDLKSIGKHGKERSATDA